MARPLRIDLAGGWYHVTARGLERRTLFRADRDREHFLELLEAAVMRFGVVIHAYVLLDNHYHLMVATPAANLSAAMQWVNVSYSVWFNRRRGRAGPVFQGRFAAVVAEPGAYAVELSRYVHLNPVRVKRLGLDKAAQGRARAGLATEQPTAELARERGRRLRSYRWSSYRAYAGWTERPAWLTTAAVLALFGGGNTKAVRENYRAFVEAAVREGLPVSPWERLEAGMVLGGKEFVARLRGVARGNVREQPALRRMAVRPGVAEVVAVVERAKGAPWAEFRDQHGDWGRDAMLWLARTSGGLKLRELADYIDVTSEATVAYAVKRFAIRLAEDAKLRKTIEIARAKLLKLEELTPKPP
jgi:REP element-mobilizing transposase RayT